MIPSNIQNIIFDLGGVVIHLDTARTFKAFAQLGDITPDQAELLYNKDPMFLSYERGGVTPAEFMEGVRHMLGRQQLSDEEVTEAWNSMLLHFPPENIELLRSLKQKGQYRLFMLSNTNVIHIEEVHRRLEKASGEPDFTNFFDKVYYSQEIGARKPDPEAYQVILDDWGLEPEETLFIDDNKANIRGAAALGIQTIHFPQNGNLPALFKNGSGQ